MMSVELLLSKSRGDTRRTSSVLRRRSLLAGLALLAAAGLSACGDGAANRTGTIRLSQNEDGTTDTSGTGGTTTTTTTTTTDTTTTTSSTPPSTHYVSGIGYSSTTVTVQANRVLKVKFLPGVDFFRDSWGRTLPYYTALGVFIGIGTDLQATALLNNGITTGTAAESSATIDLSSKFTKTCASSNTTCRQAVTITITQPNYNAHCLYQGQSCPNSRVAEGHPWRGTVLIQTDDTAAL